MLGLNENQSKTHTEVSKYNKRSYLNNKFNLLYTGFNIRLDIKYPLRPLIFFLKKLKSQKWVLNYQYLRLLVNEYRYRDLNTSHQYKRKLGNQVYMFKGLLNEIFIAIDWCI